MIPLCTPNIGGNEARYLQECVETTFVSSVGPFVDRFAAMVADATGAAAAVPTSAGTTGLHLALIAVGVGPGDLVLLPSFTFIASANAVSHCGARPWLIDVSAETWTLDPNLLRLTLERDTERRGGVVRHRATGARVGAIMPVYTLGQPADMDAICAIAAEFGLPVVSDAAAAIGARYKGHPPGRMGATLSVFSFNGNKTVTSGGGGAVFGDDADLLQLVAHLSTTARASTDYTHDRVGFNYRMTNLQAAVGCAQMERAEEFVATKRRIRAVYDRALGELAGVSLFPIPDWVDSSCWFSGIVLDSAQRVADIRTRLRDAGIEARSFWKPVHLQEPYRACLASDMPVTASVWDRILTLPCSTHLTEPDQARVIAALVGMLR